MRTCAVLLILGYAVGPLALRGQSTPPTPAPPPQPNLPVTQQGISGWTLNNIPGQLMPMMGAEASAAAVAREWATSNAMLRQMLAEYGYRPVEPPFHSRLGNGESQMLRITIRTDRLLRFQGLCDVRCLDLDLEVVNSAGRVVAADNQTDRMPAVEWQGRNPSEVLVRVLMNGCAAAKCDYQMLTFLRRP